MSKKDPLGLVWSPGDEVWVHALDEAREVLRGAARRSTGVVGVKDAQKWLRVEMFRVALLQVEGNRHAAARVLRVDRSYVLRMLREEPDLCGDADPSRGTT